MKRYPKFTADKLYELLKKENIEPWLFVNDYCIDEKTCARLFGVELKHLRKLRRLGDGPPASRASGGAVLYKIGSMAVWLNSIAANATKKS